MATLEKLPILPDGHAAMQAELHKLKTVDRLEIVTAIEEARAHGDISENAEYHAAKERQAQIEQQIIELEDQLARAQVIDPRDLSGDRVLFGATVELLDEDENKVVYQIVGPYQADAKAGRISYTSPLGRALIGRKVGDEVEVSTPSGDKYYEITKLSFI